MMGAPLLHEGATVNCAHQGQAAPNMTDVHVTVSGKKIVTQDAVYTVTGCTLSPPPTANGPCATAVPWTSPATRIKASHKPVLLKTSQANCIPTGTPLTIRDTQTRVKGT